MDRSLQYWKGVGNQRNFGDSLAELLSDELFFPLSIKARGIYVIGSYIDDLFFSSDAPDERVVFWGCGMRSEHGLSPDNRARCEILAVRGPHSRSALRLGAQIPIGDPALLLPALYEPRRTGGGTLCIPHFHDSRTDEELLALSGCDRLIRPNVPASKQALLNVIDQVASADFVLSASLHGVIIAAAYGRPFAPWDNGHLDLPFKWADFMASLNLPPLFARDAKQAGALFRERIGPSLTLPEVWPLLCSAPFALRPAAVLKVAAFVEHRDPVLSAQISELLVRQRLVADLSGWSGEGDWVASAIVDLRRELDQARTDAARATTEANQARTDAARATSEAEEARADADELRQQLIEVGNLLAAREHERTAKLAEDVEAETSRTPAPIHSAGPPSRPPRAVRIPGLGVRVPLQRARLRALAKLRSRDALVVATTPLFDDAWYLARNPDVAAEGGAALTHYFRHGAFEGRDPSPWFDSAFYLSRNADVAASRQNPLAHYLRHGWKEGRAPHPQFDPRIYLTQNRDVALAGVEPYTHWLMHGAAEGRRATPAVVSAKAPATDTLQETPRPKSIPPLPRRTANRAGPRLLIVDSRYPRPDRDSGSVTARFLIELFLELGWQVTFFADAESSLRGPYVRDLERLGVRCLRGADPAVLERFLAAEGSALALCMLFRVPSGGRHYEAVRAACPTAKLVFETVDLHFLREERQARLEHSQKALNLALATRERELYLARANDLTVVVSDFERELLAREVPGARLMTLPLILDTPGRTRPFARRHGVCFIGGFLHQPNIDAVEWFLDQVWPLVLQRLPTCRFNIVGSDLPEDLRRRASPTVNAVGYMKDLDGFLGTQRLTVAPLRYGAGVKGKVGSSLANAVPCVGTSIAVEGMGLATGDAIAVADEPQDFADAIVGIHEDEARWTHLSNAGFAHVSARYSVAAARTRIVGMLDSLGLPSGQSTPRLPSVQQKAGLP